MAVVNVVYYSKKGNTQKVAEAIAEVCGVEAFDIEEPHTIGETDLLFIGMGIYAGKPDQLLLDYLDNLPVNTIRGAALFSTSARGKDSTELVVHLLKHKGITIYPKRLTIKGQFLFFNRGRPNEKDLKKAKNFAKEVLQSFQG